MSDNTNKDKNSQINKFLYPYSPYYGEVKPENLVFNANLQEFAQKISYICNLETGGKISSINAYKQIKKLWQQLENSKENLQIDSDLEEKQ